jgi:hypothetical protein
VISEAFDNIAALPAADWFMINHSTTIGTTNWFQGNTTVFAPQASAGYIGANFNNTTATNTISNWLLAPQKPLTNGMKLRFWTRTVAGSPYPDRLQVRMSLAGASSNVGTLSTDVGDFTNLLLDINPTLVAGGYPQDWAEQVVTLTGITGTVNGRIALRYFVTGGGPTGANSDYIGVDTFSLSPPPTCSDPLHACPADVFPVGNGNGTINIDDLVTVITSFNQDNSSSNGPRPNGDCAPAPNGNCKVDIDDLVKVITNWGDCKGACCLPNGSCTPNQTQTQCAALNGTFRGFDTTCTAPCPIPPPNDLCANAATAVNGANPWNNANANTDGPAVDTACSPAPGGTRDVWFNYTATCNGHVTFDTNGTASPFTDTVLQVFNTNACQGTLLGCNDDISTSNFLSSVTVDLTTGQIVKVRCMSWATAAANQGAAVLNIACVAANNDNCIDAVAVAIPSTTNGSVLNTTQDQAPVCNGVSAGIGRWYTVIGNGNTLKACTCDSPIEPWDGRLSVYCGTSCTNLFCVAASSTFDCGNAPGCANPTTQTGAQESITWCSKAGQTYWILVASDVSVLPGDGGNYTLKISNGVACANPIQCGLPGDECAGALTVNVGANAGLTNTGATTSTGIPGGTCGGAGTFTLDTWYNFTPAVTAPYLFSLCGGGTIDSVMSVLSGTCASLTELGCDDDGCGTVASTSTITTAVSLTAGTTYKVRIGSWNNSATATFTLTITQQAPPSCPPTLPVTGCTNQIAGNGPADGVNGTRPSAGWQNGALGVMEDMVLCNAGGGTVNQIKAQFLDQIAAGTGTLSTYNTIRVSIYVLPPAGISGLDPLTAVPAYTHDFVVGVDATKVLTGTQAFGLDVEGWTCTVSPSQHFATGSYGVYFSFPQLTNAAAPSVFIATGPTGNGASGNGSSPAHVFIWGNNAGVAVNADAAQHSSFCAGGSVP